MAKGPGYRRGERSRARARTMRRAELGVKVGIKIMEEDHKNAKVGEGTSGTK